MHIVREMRRIRKRAARNNTLMKAVARMKGWSTYKYFSELDSAYKSYAIYVPATGDRPAPLVVALHGMEGTIYEFVFTDIASVGKEYGYIIACPGGERSFFDNRDGEQEVLDVISNVKRKHNINEERVYLIGISMGGRGATYIGFRNSRLFAAIASIYGTVTRKDLVQLTRNGVRRPVFVAHGELDTVVAPDDSRQLVKRLRTLDCECRFKLVEGLGHDVRVLDTVLPEMFRFFNEHIGTGQNKNFDARLYDDRPAKGL